MAQQRMALWATEADIDEDVDLSLALGNYGPSDHYDDSKTAVFTRMHGPQFLS
jgi:translation initiation factor 3 subunit L